MAFPRQVPHIPRLSETHELREDVVYAHAGGVPLRFDHYRPRKATGAAPAVVFVHGGAWMHSDPSQAAGNALHFARRDTFVELSRHGVSLTRSDLSR